MINPTIHMIIFLSALVHMASSFSVMPSSSRRGVAQLQMQSEDEIFEAEEAAVNEALHVSDSGMEAAVMERAVMLAYDMMNKKKKEFKDKVEDARAAEQQYVMMEHATEDLVKQYKENVSYKN